jgi:8-oxo-dGTP pyrophosphatase MutT (NUDIX family)
MAHIHTGDGEVDFVVDVFIVHKNTVLLRLHEKYHKWLAVGGHIELNETPDVAALREVQEEVGLHVMLYSGNEKSQPPEEVQEKNIVPPMHINLHPINEKHSHCSLIYYAYSETMVITEQENEKSGGCKWLTKNEIENSKELQPRIKFYALEALSLLEK